MATASWVYIWNTLKFKHIEFANERIHYRKPTRKNEQMPIILIQYSFLQKASSKITSLNFFRVHTCCAFCTSFVRMRPTQVCILFSGTYINFCFCISMGAHMETEPGSVLHNRQAAGDPPRSRVHQVA